LRDSSVSSRWTQVDEVQVKPINIFVSSGRKVPEKVAVPNVVGNSLTAAKSMIQSNNLEV
jgi:hypothetical protein